MYQFFVDEQQVQQGQIVITGQDVNHIGNVLRMKPGEKVRISDSNEHSYFCRITEITEDEVIAAIEEKDELGTEFAHKVYLFQGLPKKDKMEFIIQKAVELGVYEIVPVMMKRCVVKLGDEKKIQKKQERWQAIAEAAAKQCDRGIIPVVHAPITMKEAIEKAKELSYNVIPYELQEGIDHSREIVAHACKQESVGIFIGPEGGFEDSEVELAIANGMEAITLGKRILRTETAGMALLSIMMFQMQQ